jgi:hypothetical protein
LAESRNITGEGADGMRAYLREVHVPVLQCLLLGLSAFQIAVGVYWAGYQRVDADGNFHRGRLPSGVVRVGGYRCGGADRG